MAKKVAIIETKPSRTNYAQEFDRSFEFDQFQLCSDSSVKKVLKKDCDINIDTSQYDFIILVGSEPCKFYTKVSSVTEFSGKLVDGKFLPIINPSMLSFKPEMRKIWEASKTSIIDYIVNDKEDFDVSQSKVRGIRDSQELHSFLRDALSHHGNTIALDSETTALYPRNGYMLGLSICYDPQVGGAYIDTECVDEEAEELLQKLFNTKTVVFHNAKFDLAFFQYHFGFKFPKFEDTMLMHYILDENPGNHGLKQLAVKYTKYGDYEQPMYQWIDDYCKKNKVLKSMFQWEWIPFDVMVPYASIDAIVTLELYELFKVLKKNPKMLWVYENLLLEGTKFLVDVQDNGVPFSIDRLRHSQEVMQRDIDEAVKQLYLFEEVKQFEQAQGKEFNPNSVMQLRSLLFDYIGLEPTGKKTGTGANSTDAEVLKELADQHPVPAHILEIRKKSKIKNTYLDKIIPQLDADSRLRTNFNLHGTTSGRLSSSGKLNMQQLPRDNPAVKGSIMAREGYSIVSLDLTTAEVYVAAVLSGDKSLQSVFTSGGNFHSTIAHKVFKLPCSVEQVVELYPLQRQMAKAVTFGILYGAGANKISQQVTKDSGKFFSPQEAQEVIDEYFGEFNKLKAWIEETKGFIKANGFIYSHFGRKRRLPDVFSSDRAIQSHAIRSGLNFVVQSPASDVNLLGAIDTHAAIKAAKLDARIFALVHDSVLAEVRDDVVQEYSDILVSCIQKDRGISIPGFPIGVEIEVGKDYSMGKYDKLYGHNV